MWDDWTELYPDSVLGRKDLPTAPSLVEKFQKSADAGKLLGETVDQLWATVPRGNEIVGPSAEACGTWFLRNRAILVSDGWHMSR